MMAGNSECADASGSLITDPLSADDVHLVDQDPNSSTEPHNPLPTPTGSSPASESHPDRAVVIRKMRSEDEEASKISEFFSSHITDFGFQPVKEHIEAKEQLDDIKPKLTDLADKSGALAALVLWESSREADLDDIVASLPEGRDSAERYIVFCRIVSPGEQHQASEFLKSSSEMSDACKKVRNLAIISCAVKTSKLAGDALKKIIDVTKRCWHSDGLKKVMLCYEETSNYGIKLYFSQDGSFTRSGKPCVPDEFKLFLLPQCQQIIKDGSQFKSLDRSVQARLREGKPVSLEVIRRTEGAKPDGNHTDVHPVYKINHSDRKCQALIINNVDFEYHMRRSGSDADFANLEHALGLLQFQVTEKRNLKASEMREEVSKFAERTEHGDACVLVIMSHGSLNYICGTDAKRDELEGVVKLQDLLDDMSFGKKVKRKPRVVLFQACRNDDDSDGEANGEKSCTTRVPVGMHYSNGSQLMSVQISPDQCGLIVGYATCPKESAYRSDQKGSRFMLAVCATIYEFAHKEDMVAMITRINNIMTHEFDYPKDNYRKYPMQLPSWTVQTDKMFFLVDTSDLFSSQDSPLDAAGQAKQEPPASGEVEDDEGNEKNREE